MVVAHLVERSLPIPEVRGSNPDIGILFILNICLLSTVYWKDENKEKEAGYGPFKKKTKKNLYLLLGWTEQNSIPSTNVIVNLRYANF